MNRQAPITHSIAEAVDCLRRGGLVAIPTETVYGLAADARNPVAVQRIFEVKGRPTNHPLIVHFSSADLAFTWSSSLQPWVPQLARRFWPGPLTLIVPKQPWVLDLITAGQGSVGLRVPNHPLTRDLLAAFGGGLAAPSANRFTKVSPTTTAHVQKDLGDRIDLILEGGPCGIGIESTIVDCTQSFPVLLRPGYITVEELESELKMALQFRNAAGVLSPGQHAVHYSPEARLYLVPEADIPEQARRFALEGKKVLALRENGEALKIPNTIVWQLPREPSEFARRIYGFLREADANQFDVILVPPPAPQGIGMALSDRLRKASSPLPASH